MTTQGKKQMPIQSDDYTGEYMKQREAVNLTPAQRLLKANAGEAETPVDVEGRTPMEISPLIGMIPGGGAVKQIIESAPTKEQIKAAGKDVAIGVVEAPKQIAGGVISAAREAGKAVEGLFEFFNSPQILQVTNEKGEIDLSLVTKKEFQEAGGKRIAEVVTPAKARTKTGGMIRGISQFLTGFIPATKAMKGIGGAGKIAKTARAAGAGMVADALVFDPQEQRLSNLIEKYPELQNPVTEYLQAEPDDSELEGRFKNALEGLGVGLVAEGFMAALRGVRSSRIKKLETDEAAKEAETIEKFAAIEDVKPDEVVEPVPVEKKPDEPMFKVGRKKAGEERALNINLDRVNTTEEVKELITGVGEKFSKDINKARREVITREETKKLADDLGMTVEDLLNRRQGEAFNAEQALAARRILVASGENLIKLAKTATMGGDEAVIQFRRALSQHNAIQSQVSGLTAEAGRALQSFNISSAAGKQQQQLIKDMLATSGGIEGSKTLAGMVSALETPLQLNTFVKQASKAKTKDMIYEAWINSLLSSPATHTVNVLGNSMTAAWAVGERKVASVIGGALDRQNVPAGEASQMLYGMTQGAKEGLSLAWKALKTGEPADVLTKQESAAHRAITSDNLNLAGTPGRFADYVGSTIRLPSRFLTAGDEFFKTVGYRMELHAQAYRQGIQEGLEGDELAVRIYDIVQNPPENLKLNAIDFSRYQTFTKPLGEAGQSIQTAAQRIPGARIIVPFIRTPMNIMKYATERTPLSFLAPQIREEIAAGGARRDMALAKIATGSMVMAAAADMTMSDQITGGGPKNPKMRNMLRATGWQPYSVKVGDKYVSYGRLDPLGATIGIAADVTEIMAQTTDAETIDLATAATISVAQNITSKTYMKGLSEFFDVMSSVSPDPEKNNTRAIKWAERLGGTIVPSGVAQLERTLDPSLSATNGIIDRIKSRIPGYSDDLPPRRNIFGEEIVLSGGIGPDIMSPLYVSEVKNDVVAEEIVSQRTLLSMPTDVIDGVQLDTKMYDNYIRYYAGENNRYVKMPLKRKLKELFKSDMYRQATDDREGGKSVLIRAVFEGYRETAKQMMREKTPEIRREARKLKTEKLRKLGAAI